MYQRSKEILVAFQLAGACLFSHTTIFLMSKKCYHECELIWPGRLDILSGNGLWNSLICSKTKAEKINYRVNSTLDRSMTQFTRSTVFVLITATTKINIKYFARLCTKNNEFTWCHNYGQILICVSVHMRTYADRWLRSSISFFGGSWNKVSLNVTFQCDVSVADLLAATFRMKYPSIPIHRPSRTLQSHLPLTKTRWFTTVYLSTKAMVTQNETKTR